MKRFIALFAVVILMVLCAAPALAAGLRLSPARVEFDVPADGSTRVEFTIYDFTGNLKISLRDIPLRVEPTTVPVMAKEGGTRVVLTFYGDESLGSKIYQGKIRFMAETGGSVAVAIDVRATITNMVEGETPVPAPTEQSPEKAPPEEAPTPSEQTPPPEQAPTPPLPPEEAPTTTGLPILPIIGIAAGTIVAVTLIVVLIRRPRY